MESTAETARRLLTPEEAAAELRVARQTIYRMIGDGRLPAFRVGENGPLRIEPEALDGLLEVARAEEQREREEAAAALREFRGSQPLRPVLLGELDERRRQWPTLAAAAATVEQLGGRVELDPHGLPVLLVPERLEPPGSKMGGASRAKLITAARVLHEGREVVRAVLAQPARKGQLLSSRLPDAPTTALGGVAEP